jgi:hypothetical protein
MSAVMSNLQFSDQDVLNPRYAGDKRLIVRFYKNAIFNEFKSNEQGRAIYDEIDYIRIITPGSRDDFHTEATREYQNRFPEHWARFKAQEDQAVSGTPISMVPWLSIGQVEELKFFHITTVEQILDAPDAVAQKFSGFHMLKQKAKTFLDASASEAEKTRLEGMLAERDAKITSLEQNITAMGQKLDQLLVAKK